MEHGEQTQNWDKEDWIDTGTSSNNRSILENGYDKLKEKAVFHVATSSDVGNRAGGKRPHVWFAHLIIGHIIIMSEEKSLQNGCCHCV